VDLVISEYKKILKKKLIIDDISYTFSSGKIYGLYGRNGSGKTMILRALCGLIHPTDGTVKFDGEILGKDMGILIGYRGETLDSLHYLTSLAINKDTTEKYKRVILDTQNYRAKRTEILKGLAIKKAKRAKMFNKAIKLEPMNPYERRIIHSALQNDNYVKTFSEGNEPYRRVVIEPKRKKA